MTVQTILSLQVAEALTEFGYTASQAAALVAEYHPTQAEFEDDSPHDVANIIDHHYRGGLRVDGDPLPTSAANSALAWGIAQ